MLGRYDRSDGVILAGETMIEFGVVAGVSSHARESYALECIDKEWAKLVHIGARAAAGVEGENEMIARIADDAQFGIAVINDGFPGASDLFAPANEIGVRRPAWQPRAVNGRRPHATTSPHLLSHGRVQQASGGLNSQQSTPRFLQRRKVQNPLEFKRLDQCWMVGQVFDDASIVGFQKVLEHQAGEELMLSKNLGAIPVCVSRQRTAGNRQRGQHHLSRRFTRRRHALSTNACSNLV